MKERDVVIDIENCLNTIDEAQCPDVSSEKVEGLSKGENLVNPSTGARNVKPEKNVKKEKRFSTSAKKPPKPPRPPRGLALDSADMKLIKEISEHALAKRARIERLKKMKAAKASSGSSSSSGNLIAMFFTLLFCVVIIFGGCHPSQKLRTSNGTMEGNVVGVESPSSMDKARKSLY